MTTKMKSPLDIARARLTKAEAALHSAARADMHTARGFEVNQPIHDRAKAALLDAKLAFKEAEIAAQLDDAEANAIAAFLVDALEIARADYAKPQPTAPVLASIVPAALIAHAAALVAFAADAKDAKERIGATYQRLHFAHATAHAAQEMLRAQRKANEGVPPRALVSSAFSVPVNSHECDAAIAELRAAGAPDVAAIEYERDRLLEGVAERQAEAAARARRESLSDQRRRFEQNHGAGSSSAEDIAVLSQAGGVL